MKNAQRGSNTRRNVSFRYWVFDLYLLSAFSELILLHTIPSLTVRDWYMVTRKSLLRPSIQTDDWIRYWSQINRDILGKLDAWHCPESGEIRFRGLMIRNYWECNQQHALLIIIVILVLLSIPFAKLIFNDWDVAWNVGCFFVGLLGLQWLNNFFVNRCCRSTCWTGLQLIIPSAEGDFQFPVRQHQYLKQSADDHRETEEIRWKTLSFAHINKY